MNDFGLIFAALVSGVLAQTQELLFVEEQEPTHTHTQLPLLFPYFDFPLLEMTNVIASYLLWAYM